MFRIRKEQLEHFADRAREQFVVKMRAYVRESFGDYVEGKSDTELERFTRDALARCERFGVVTEPEAAQLVLLYLQLGLDVHEREPWAREALEARGLLPIGKVRKLVRAARANGFRELDDVLVYDEMAERDGEVRQA